MKSVNEFKKEQILKLLRKKNFGIDHWNGKDCRILDELKNPIINVDKKNMIELVKENKVKIVNNYLGYSKIYYYEKYEIQH